MRSIIVFGIVAIVSIDSFAACRTEMDSFHTTDLNKATNWGARSLDATILYNEVLQPNIQRLEATLGSLQRIPIKVENIGAAAGTSSLNMSWQPLIVALAKKLANSPTGDEDIRYLLSALGNPGVEAIVGRYATSCSGGKDGTENVVLMIDQVADHEKLPEFLLKVSTYLKKGNPRIQHTSDTHEDQNLPYSRMPPI
jgi:hypothetical protein